MDDVTPVFFFQSGDSDRYALSLDRTGCNVPRAERPWFLRGTIAAKEWPAEFRYALQHVAKHGFSILRCVDEEVE